MRTHRLLRHAMRIAALALITTPAMAQTPAGDTGLYLGYSLGVTRYALDNGGLAESEIGRTLGPSSARRSDSNMTTAGGKITLGYDVSRHLGAEAALVNLGKYRAKYFTGGTTIQTASEDFSASAVAIAGTARYEFDSGVVLKAKAGVALTEAISDYQVARPAGTLASNDPTASKTNFYWGLAAGYRFNPKWTLYLDFDDFGTVGSRSSTGQAKAQSLMASLQYRF